MIATFKNDLGEIRLDSFLSSKVDECSRQRAQRLCADGVVLVNGRREKAGFYLKGGEEIVLEKLPVVVEPRIDLVETCGGARQFIDVLFEDDDLLVVSKPRLMHSIRLAPEDEVTLADCVASISEACISASRDKREAGLVQRLDFYTSGVVLAVKNRAMWDEFHGMLLGGAVNKEYLALVEGKLPKEEIEISGTLISASGGRKMAIERIAKAGSEEMTTIACEVAETSSEKGVFSIVRVFGNRLRRHQIRVHLAEIGCPLVGDKAYGAERGLNEVVSETCLSLAEARAAYKKESGEGFFLHAEKLNFDHPKTGKATSVTYESDYFLYLLRSWEKGVK